MDRRRILARNIGLLLVLSTPVSAFISFALFSVILGEDRLENNDGTTALGYAVMALPILTGIAIAAWAQFGGPLPSRMALASGLLSVSILMIGAGVWSIVDAGSDASIGGALLVFGGVATLVIAATLTFTRNRSSTPPPPTAPGPA